MHFKGGNGSYGFRLWKLSLSIYLADRGGHGGHSNEKFVKILFLGRVIRIAVIVSQLIRLSLVVTRQQLLLAELAISVIISKRSFWALK